MTADATLDMDAGPRACKGCGDEDDLLPEGTGFHRYCCDHEEVEHRDDRDDGAGTVWDRCEGCGTDVTYEIREREFDRYVNDELARMKEER